MRRAYVQALERHNVPADEVDLINPHGTSTPLGDLREAQAIWNTWGEHTPKIAISATKSLTGHLMGAAGAIEGVATVLSVYNQCAPATANYRDADPGDQPGRRVTASARSMEIRYAVSNNIGLGGHNGAVIFKRYDGGVSASRGRRRRTSDSVRCCERTRSLVQFEHGVPVSVGHGSAEHATETFSCVGAGHARLVPDVDLAVAGNDHVSGRLDRLRGGAF